VSVLERIPPLHEPVGFRAAPSGLLVPSDRAITYPGNDAWLELESRVQDPGADPAWAMVETVPDSGGIPNKTLTAQGVNPPSTQNATSVFGGSSLLFPSASGTAIQAPDSPDWFFGTGDFTIEGWWYTTLTRKCFLSQRTPAGDVAWEFTADAMASANPGFTFYYCYTEPGTSFDVQWDNAYTLVTNTWQHYAVVRIGTVLKLFIQGVQLGADHNIASHPIRDSAGPLTVCGDNRSSGGNDFRGYADEIRISKGIARYTSNFTVPTSPFTRDQYTVLLLHCDGPNGGTAYTDSSGVAGAPFDPGSDPAWMEVER